MAIGISVKKGTEDEGVSKFFGAPTVPAEWVDSFDDELILFCQIKLEDISELDIEGKLPHAGYLYIFLDTSNFPFRPVVRIYDGEPDTVIDDFNDSAACAEELAGRLRGWLTHVNLIPLNEVEGRSYKTAKGANVKRFRDILEKNGVAVTVRRTLGSDIDAACGQLRRRHA